MSKELTTYDFNTQLEELDKIQMTCKKLLETRHYQALGEAGIHAIMARAKSLGIHPFEALNGGFTCIQGKVGMSTEMMAALVRQRGHSIRKDPKSTSECVILHGKRADNGDEWTCTFSKEDAIAAGLWNSTTWKKYPGVMLYNRCMSQLFRQLFPDLSLGAGYVEDELKEITRTGEYQVELQTDSYSVKPAEKTFKKTINKADIPVKIDNVKPLDIAPPQVEKISKEQAQELIMFLDECDPEYKKIFKAGIKTQWNADDMFDIPEKEFIRVKNTLAKNMEEWHAKQRNEFKQPELVAQEVQ